MQRARTLLAILVVALVAPAFAAEFTVTTTADGADPSPGNGICDDGTGECTLRAAIQTANAIAGSDDVILLAGVYELTLKRDTDLADDVTGDLDVTTDIAILGTGQAKSCEGVDCTAIDGKGGKDRIFDVSDIGELQLNDLVVMNGKAAKDDLNATQLGEISGGCIRAAGRIDLDRVRVERCSSPDDGGCIGLVEEAEADLLETALAGCKAKDGGGGIEGDGASIDLDRVTISGSSAGDDGGGVEMSSGELEATNVTLSGNKAKEGGGFELEEGATADLNNVTLFANKAGDGGNVHVDDSSTLTISNSIVSSKKGNDCSGPVTSDDNNLDGGASCGFGEAGDQSNVDPLLEELLDNGGEVPTHALGVGSPAIDRGDDGSCENEDARNQDRFDVNGVGTVDTECDVGAFEFIPPM